MKSYSLPCFRIIAVLQSIHPSAPLSNAPNDAPEVQLHLGVFPDLDHYSNAARTPNKLIYVSSYTDEIGQPALRASEAAGGALLHLAYSDGTQFWLDRNGTAIWAVWPERSSLENAVSYLLGPVLGLVLRLAGSCLPARKRCGV